MKKTILVLGALLAGGFNNCGGSNISSGKTLINVNGEKITEGHLGFLATLNPNIARQTATPFGKKQLLDNLVEQELFYQAAKKEGLHRDTKVQAKIDLYRKVILAQSFVESQAEKEAKQYYDEHKAEFERVGLAHIMIRFATPEEMKAAQKAKKPAAKMRAEQEALKLANQVTERLNKGEKFEGVAKQFSEDELTKDKGGEMGFVSKSDPRFAMRGFQPLLEKAFTMKVAEIAGPIKTTAGYHVLTVTKPSEQAGFEEVKDQLAFRQRGEIKNKILAELKAKGKIVYAEELKPEEKSDTQNDAAKGGIKEVPGETPQNPQPSGHAPEPHQH